MYRSSPPQLATTSARLIARRIRRAVVQSGQYVIAIDGYSGAGKSTLTAHLLRLLPSAQVVQMDDYMNNDRISHNSADKEAFDRQRLVRETLVPMSDSSGAGIVIVEGVTSSHPDMAALIDLRIWVRLPRLVALARAEDRDHSQANFDEAVWEEWSASDRLYYEKYRPDLSADIIYDNRARPRALLDAGQVGNLPTMSPDNALHRIG